MTSTFRFGLISDIQYADIEDASNFSGYEHRTYRASARHARDVIHHWRSLERPPSLIAQLGDLIDGQNAGEYGQGLNFDAPRSEQALTEVLEAWRGCDIPTYHAIGNHELYNFDRDELAERLNRHPHHIYDEARGEFYFSWRPVGGWRFIMLNGYELSVMKPRSPETLRHTEALLRAHNPNYGQPEVKNFFDGLEPEQMRFVPFNGGFGAEQLAWLDAELNEAREMRERVIVMSHLPIYAPAASMRNIAFDSHEALEILGCSGVVQAYLSGHSHAGGLGRDESGIHHLTTQAPLTHGLCAATVDVYEDRIEVSGVGSHRSHHLELA